MARTRSNGRVDNKGPPPAPVALGTLLQRFLAALIQRAGPSLLLRLVASPTGSRGPGVGDGQEGGAGRGVTGGEEEDETVMEAVLAAIAPFLPRLLAGDAAWERGGEEVQSAVTKSGKTRVSRVTAQVCTGN